MYQSPPDLTDALVVGISQSGQSPDIVSVIEEGKRQGVVTLAITNAANSPLAESSDFVIDIGAGVETAVAATKTYTAQLLAIAILSVVMTKDSVRMKELKALPGHLSKVLDLDPEIQRMAERYRYMQQCVVLGRGYNYATAFEWSLKLKELAYVVAAPYSSADFQHGPIAIVSKGFPVFAVIPKGKVYKNMYDQLSYLRKEYQVELLAISNDSSALSLAHSPVELPLDLPEWLSPIVAIVPAQLFSYHLTRVKDLDTESPRGLSKVTLTE
jgi:glucosamine--fructose-6-phosphate aminotransferase (isomerizing)